MDRPVLRLIEALELKPHPEGGFYREFFRSPQVVLPSDGRGERSALTAIYFLLPGESRSRWHVVHSDEQWVHLEGGPIELVTFDPRTNQREVHLLGPLHEHERVATVRAGCWQAARPRDRYGLVVCTTGPGFDFADFSIVSEDPGAARRIRAEWPDVSELL